VPVAEKRKRVRTTTAYKGFVTINRDTYEEPNGAVTG
jgi:ADP-ribose pyrophosphatase